MPSKLEKLVKVVYQKWKLGYAKIPQLHPDEETMACFLENRLSQEEARQIKAHLVSCDSCAEGLAVQLKLKASKANKVPEDLIARLKDLVIPEEKAPLLEILLRLKEKAIEILSTTGQVLVGQELVAAPVLRSRKIKDFPDETTILKDFEKTRVEVKIENKHGQAFSLTVMAKEKDTQRVIRDLRITLIQDDRELESYLTDSGKVTFEHVLLGKYRVEISTVEERVASILLDIKT